MKLELAAQTMGIIGVYMAFIVLTIIVIQVVLDVKKLDWQWNENATSDLIEGVITAIVLIVVVVPEGWPLAVTLALAFTVG